MTFHTEDHGTAGTADSRRSAAWQRALDPSTPGDQLAAIAYEFPEFGPAVSGHPNSYPGLKAWIGQHQVQLAVRTHYQQPTPVSTPGVQQPASISSATRRRSWSVVLIGYLVTAVVPVSLFWLLIFSQTDFSELITNISRIVFAVSTTIAAVIAIARSRNQPGRIIGAISLTVLFLIAELVLASARFIGFGDPVMVNATWELVAGISLFLAWAISMRHPARVYSVALPLGIISYLVVLVGYFFLPALLVSVVPFGPMLSTSYLLVSVIVTAVPVVVALALARWASRSPGR